MKAILALILFPLFSHASAHQLSCSISLNLDKVVDVQVLLPANANNYQFATFQDFRFFLTDTGNKVELQIFNPADPSRTYAIANLDQSKEIELTVWKREYLLTTQCVVMP